MNYSKNCGALKLLEEVTLPDPRFENEILRSDAGERLFELADIHERLQISKFNDTVPETIRIQQQFTKRTVLADCPDAPPRNSFARFNAIVSCGLRRIQAFAESPLQKR